ncbi:uncharacterized protein TNCV_4993501 [Trichonephila clavipes]|nr:uncharacterized protein TNCV_4993501 [Trichonephila clavipes]
MRQDQYKDVLQNRLIPQLEEWFPNGEPDIFIQDGASCHTARSITPFLTEQNIPLLDWPGSKWSLRRGSEHAQERADALTENAVQLKRLCSHFTLSTNSKAGSQQHQDPLSSTRTQSASTP